MPSAACDHGYPLPVSPLEKDNQKGKDFIRVPWSITINSVLSGFSTSSKEIFKHPDWGKKRQQVVLDSTTRIRYKRKKGFFNPRFDTAGLISSTLSVHCTYPKVKDCSISFTFFDLYFWFFFVIIHFNVTNFLILVEIYALRSNTLFNNVEDPMKGHFIAQIFQYT